MKKFSALLMFLFFFAGLAAAAFTNIGYIDVQKVFTDYKETNSAQKQLTKKEEEFKKAFEDSQKKILEAEKKSQSSSEVSTLTKKLEKELEPKRKELLSLNQELTSKLQVEILTAVKSVAKKLGIEVVLDKQVIITGGIDLTDMTINELNK